MAALGPFFAWLQATKVASTIGQSTTLTGFLSALHLVGLTILVGGAFVSGMRLLGFLLPERPVPEIAGTPARFMALGLAVSVTTGLLLFSARAPEVGVNETFQLKMALLAIAAVFHFAIYRKITQRTDAAIVLQRLTGLLGLSLWFGVALAGCAFILLE